MYFNAYFKEMKIGAQREAWQSWSSCVQLAPGQAALQWPHAKVALIPGPWPLCCIELSLSLQHRPTGGRTRSKEEKGVLALPLAITAPGLLLVPGEGARCCFGWDARLCSGCSSQLQQYQLCCSGTGAQDQPGMLAPAADPVGDGDVSASAPPVCKSQSCCASLRHEIRYLQCTPLTPCTVLLRASLEQPGFALASPALQHCIAGRRGGSGPAGSLSASQWALLMEKPL